MNTATMLIVTLPILSRTSTKKNREGTMKKILFNKKLALKKTTIASLSGSTLNKAKGGTGETFTCPLWTCANTCHCTKPYYNTCGDTCDYTCNGCGTYCSDCWTQRLC